MVLLLELPRYPVVLTSLDFMSCPHRSFLPNLLLEASWTSGCTVIMTIEPTAVVPEGRTTDADLGLYIARQSG